MTRDLSEVGGDLPEKVECENCGQQRFTFEACHHCGNKHWANDD